MLQIKFIYLLLIDCFRLPCQFIANFFHSNNNHMLKIDIDEVKHSNINEFHFIIHHLASRSLEFNKEINNKSFNLGIKNLLKEINESNLSNSCFVADPSEDYYKFLKENYPNINFYKGNSKAFDFSSYFIGARKFKKISNKKFFCFANDNIDLNSKLIPFLNKVKNSLNKNKIGMLGISCNSHLTQSIFSKSFSPHVQTFFFIARANLFNEFAQNYKWFPRNKLLNFLKKQSICRLFEQGINSFILKKGYYIGYTNKNNLFLYKRRYKHIDLKKDWVLDDGDMRLIKDKPFLIN